jgi:amidase
MLTHLDLGSASATRLAQAIRDGNVSSEELVQAHLARIDQVNPRLNAVVARRDESALREAREADARRSAGAPLGSLHGVPITIKDCFDLAGLPHTSGTLGRKDTVPTSNATAVQRLIDAGAIVVGKTNTPELTLAYETDNLVYGRTNNPHDASRTPGGSSGGEAAIIASGGSALGLGTDIGGSIRVPAHFCGIAGLKPTLGRVPTTGAFPPAVGLPGGLYHVGPLARSVEDLDLALRVLAGPDGRDPRCTPAALQEPSAVNLGSLRVAYYSDNGLMPATAETAAAVGGAARALAGAGCSVSEARPEGVEHAFELFARLFGADDSAAVLHLLEMIGTTQPSPLLVGLGQTVHAFATSAAGLSGLLAEIDVFRLEMLGFLASFDVIISPVTAAPACAHGTSLDPEVLPGFSYAMLHDLTGWPAVVVRGGTSPEGLPIGVQVVAAPWRENIALAAARVVERTLSV